ncbi:olfactory receptor 287-like [Bos indicus]|uniref:Olfactory receptor 287-like n=1 Tax=Bos indicus TaxID=9915 RepID=A0ABM4RLZ6_BOSIN
MCPGACSDPRGPADSRKEHSGPQELASGMGSLSCQDMAQGVPSWDLPEPVRWGPVHLAGLPGARGLHVELFLLTYVLTVAGNLAILSLVGAHRRLQTPIYFFLCNLSFLEIWFTTACMPKTLAVFTSRSGAISFSGCAVQMHFVFSLGCTEDFLLAAMAYDCYLAVCLPLRYGSFMTPRFSGHLPPFLLWLTGPQPLLGHPALDRAAFCVILGFRVITLVYDVTTLGVITLVCHVITLGVITLVSYAHIVVAVVRTPSLQGRPRAFSACSSHLAVVLIWYGPTVFLHVRTLVESSLDLTKAVAVLSTTVTPVLNPFIYTLRNEDVKEALRKGVWWT